MQGVKYVTVNGAAAADMIARLSWSKNYAIALTASRAYIRNLWAVALQVAHILEIYEP